MKNIAVIGGGPAGLEASRQLNKMGFSVTLFEKDSKAGGHAKNWHALFPDLKPGNEVIDSILKDIDINTTMNYNMEITGIQSLNRKFAITAANGMSFMADAVLMTTGFDLFNSSKKEEYGYGIYDKVITSADLEEYFHDIQKLKTKFGNPQRIGFVHCVGSRDEKAGNIYCSKVCCVTAVKQAMELREFFPEAEIFCFYMDLRMFGRYYEEMYKDAQEKSKLQFIRGRLSEATENKEGHVLVKVEDTLLGKPLKITVDLLVLMAGMVAPQSSIKLRDELGLSKEEDRFFKPASNHLGTNMSEIPGLFFAGTCTGPKTLTDTITDARSASLAINEYFSTQNLNNGSK